MGLGGGWDDASYAPADVDRAREVVEAALAAGLTWFDHADIYARGGAEAVFGELLAEDPGLRARVRLQTKCGIRLPEDGSVGRYDLSPRHVRASVEGSLERLRTDRVEVLLLHRPDPLADLPVLAAELEALVAEGLVGAVGVSNAGAAQVQALQSHLALPLVANQVEAGLHRRGFVEAGVLVGVEDQAPVHGFPLGTVEHCTAAGVRLQAWGALAQGRYSGRASTPVELAAQRLVRELAERHGTTPESVVLWWLRHHPAQVVPVVGTTSPARIAACADAVAHASRLTDDEWYALWVAARGVPLP
jgi:predicted oxidoreductase